MFNANHLVDASKHELLTSDGKRFRYRYLCLCHGACPKVIDASNPFILGIRDTESVQHFQERLSGSRRIAVVGNGGIATEIVHELEGVDIVWAIKVIFQEIVSGNDISELKWHKKLTTVLKIPIR
jgi:hypothetical protein